MMRRKRKRILPRRSRLVGGSKRMYNNEKVRGIYIHLWDNRSTDQQKSAAKSDVNGNHSDGRIFINFGKGMVSAYLIRVLEISTNSDCHGRRRGEI